MKLKLDKQCYEHCDNITIINMENFDFLSKYLKLTCQIFDG